MRKYDELGTLRDRKKTVYNINSWIRKQKDLLESLKKKYEEMGVSFELIPGEGPAVGTAEPNLEKSSSD